ncbi:MAG TPA: HDIG domain-containing protein [Tepidisphaeraceae bacterium]|nr:HDIG domain-containing protein [Tepidisphaeraceae bacterium]
MIDRDAAWGIVCEFVKDIGLRRHMLSVEAAMRFYARRLNADERQWGLAGLLHDFDWEIHPTLEGHPAKGAPILRERGVDEPVIQCILSHNTIATGVARQSPMDFALLACDEITGLITAVALVRPTKNIADVEVRSVKKKWKEKYFAAGVHREEVEAATADFSRQCFDGKLDLWEHVGNVLEAMKGIAGDLGLAGEAAVSQPNPQ